MRSRVPCFLVVATLLLVSSSAIANDGNGNVGINGGNGTQQNNTLGGNGNFADADLNPENGRMFRNPASNTGPAGDSNHPITRTGDVQTGSSLNNGNGHNPET